jgi:hypothetical protein
MENIFQKKLDEIACSDINNLITIGYKERQSIEYKKEMYGRSDSDKKEMLKDISSMANAYGGYLLIGIEADASGIPIKPFHIADAEKERDRIEQSCISSIEPRISGLKSKTIKLDSGEEIIIIFIPRSIKKPHMVSFSGLDQFWIRHNDKKFPMAVEEIKDACINVENIWNDMKQFLKERELELNEEIRTNAFLIIGSSPIFIKDDIIDITDHKIINFLIKPPDQTNENFNLSFEAVGPEDCYPEPTLNGLKISSPSYITVELNRNGYFEARIPMEMFSYPAIERKEITLIHHKRIINIVVNYFRALAGLTEILGIEQTIVAYMSLFNIEGLVLKYGKKAPYAAYAKPVSSSWLNRNMKIPPKQIFSLNNPDKEAKYFLDRLWNAYGFVEAPYFKDDKYCPK